MDVIDRNERKFKELAEQMIEKSSYLINAQKEEEPRKLLLYTHFPTISNQLRSKDFNS